MTVSTPLPLFDYADTLDRGGYLYPPFLLKRGYFYGKI